MAPPVAVKCPATAAATSGRGRAAAVGHSAQDTAPAAVTAEAARIRRALAALRGPDPDVPRFRPGTPWTDRPRARGVPGLVRTLGDIRTAQGGGMARSWARELADALDASDLAALVAAVEVDARAPQDSDVMSAARYEAVQMAAMLVRERSTLDDELVAGAPHWAELEMRRAVAHRPDLSPAGARAWWAHEDDEACRGDLVRHLPLPPETLTRWAHALGDEPNAWRLFLPGEARSVDRMQVQIALAGRADLPEAAFDGLVRSGLPIAAQHLLALRPDADGLARRLLLAADPATADAWASSPRTVSDLHAFPHPWPVLQALADQLAAGGRLGPDDRDLLLAYAPRLPQAPWRQWLGRVPRLGAALDAPDLAQLLQHLDRPGRLAQLTHLGRAPDQDAPAAEGGTPRRRGDGRSSR